MPTNLTRKLLAAHADAEPGAAGEPIDIRIDQTLTQDATGTLVMLALEAIGLDRVRTELSVQYVDHNLVQEDHRNADDHRYLLSACRRFGVWYSPPGNGVSHPVHQQFFGRPGATLLGSDSHTPAAGALGMLAIGAGGLEVALAMAGEPYRTTVPEVWGVRLHGRLPDGVSAKDVVLEMLRRHGVRGGLGRVVEYHGTGLAALSAMDRHVIANMGTELGATSTVFPADDAVRRYLEDQRRGDAYVEWLPDPGATYDVEEEIDLETLEPLIATPSSPGNVVPVREVAGRPIRQAYIGSSANPGYRDFAVAAEIVRGHRVPANVSLDVNPSSRRTLHDLALSGHLAVLIEAGARIHQAGCNGCIGMGQAPPTGGISLRTVPRNFPGRSGTLDDRVYLCSPETAAASALGARITDPRDLRVAYPEIAEPAHGAGEEGLFARPLPLERAREVRLEKGPNIAALPELDELPERIEAPVLLKAADDISTDEILPAGAHVLPYRSNVPKIAEFAFRDVDPDYVARAKDRLPRRHVILGGRNYGQGSSREHAALAPRFLGLVAVVAAGFARIHARNLVNFGVAPLAVDDADAIAGWQVGDTIRIDRLRERLREHAAIAIVNVTRHGEARARCRLTDFRTEVLLAGGLINLVRERSEA